MTVGDPALAAAGGLTITAHQLAVLETCLTRRKVNLRQLLRDEGPVTADELAALVDDLAQQLELMAFDPGARGSSN